MDIYDNLFQSGFGLVNLGSHRGLFYSSKDSIKGCPRGWLFVDSESIKTAEEIRLFAKEYPEVVKRLEAKVQE